MTTAFELYPEGATPALSTETFCWPASPGSTPSVITDTGAWLGALGVVPAAAVDLVRIAAGAYMADRRSPRGRGFTRTIDLHVQLVRADAFVSIIDDIADLLAWLTGDHWRLSLSDDGLAFPLVGVDDVSPAQVTTVALLSGGLDSFCGALLAGPQNRLFLGHWDGPTVKGAQNRVRDWLDTAFEGALDYRLIRIVQAEARRESSSRSRSFLFMALGSAVAEARHATILEIPENGFTSLNPPLGPERGGALSTRSTHPLTITRFNAMLEALGLTVRLSDPYASITKGQLVTLASEQDVPDFALGVAATLSCGKLDGARYRGGNPNHHCGLCIPCIVRRGAIAVAGLADHTPYLSHTLAGASLAKLRGNRSNDVAAARRAVDFGFTDELLIAMGPYPPGYDIDAAIELCGAGLREIAHVDLGE